MVARPRYCRGHAHVSPMWPAQPHPNSVIFREMHSFSFPCMKLANLHPSVYWYVPQDMKDKKLALFNKSWKRRCLDNFPKSQFGLTLLFCMVIIPIKSSSEFWRQQPAPLVAQEASAAINHADIKCCACLTAFRDVPMITFKLGRLCIPAQTCQTMPFHM
jgi:hypothetical protein